MVSLAATAPLSEVMTCRCSGAASSASPIASSMESASSIRPLSVQVFSAPSPVGSPRAWSRISAGRRSASSLLVVTTTAHEPGPCSHLASTSAATHSGLALSSAIMTTSLGPASMSIPTLPATWRLASVT